MSACLNTTKKEKSQLCQIKATAICQSRRYAHTQMLNHLESTSYSFLSHQARNKHLVHPVLQFLRKTSISYTHFQLTTTASGSNLLIVQVRRQQILF